MPFTFIHDLVFLLFADDTTFVKAGPNLNFIIIKLQEVLDALTKWCDTWGFKISVEKTTAVLFSSYHCTIQGMLTIRGVPIPVENCFKFLGVIFDRQLTWAPHAQYLQTKTASRLNLLTRLTATGWGASAHTLLILYKAMVKSVMMYGSQAFSNAPPATIKKLELIQRRALTIALGVPRSTRVENTLALAGQPPLRFEFTKKLRRLSVKAFYNPSLFIADIFKDSWFLHYDTRARPQPFIMDSFVAIKPVLAEITCCDSQVSALPPWSLKPHRLILL